MNSVSSTYTFNLHANEVRNFARQMGFPWHVSDVGILSSAPTIWTRFRDGEHELLRGVPLKTVVHIEQEYEFVQDSRMWKSPFTGTYQTEMLQVKSRKLQGVTQTWYTLQTQFRDLEQLVRVLARTKLLARSENE